MKWEAKYSKLIGSWYVEDEKGKLLSDLQDEQTARLIAAAPELLENLKRIIDRIKENDLQQYFPSAFERADKLLNSISQP